MNNSIGERGMKEHFEMTDEELQRLDGPAGILHRQSNSARDRAVDLAAIVAAKNGVKLPEQAMVSSAKEAASMVTPFAVCGV
ncbi:hypothetical protein BZM27_52695 [Paraburkholderia steynii]|uniref:Uncharacterized protein n=1 Tax=Paraburkholderia steynii TaxID=1245441 RepID=A0A4R0X2H1_9BURK|nr:hypothetical protein BZM27_52695 [Paraburkholderia steynii]